MARRARKIKATEASRAAHRERQRRYRERLREERHPESDDVQRAIFAAVRGAVFNVRRGRGSGDEIYDGLVATFLRSLIEKSIDDLVAQGFDRGRVKRRMHLALIPPYPGPALKADG
ncbi:hypothetical protein [Microvirga calopogonii]|uniref:hypothetical protein n=1 Tax=Microvirga calopogonii TaxID=2078013 RepID=UPI000E0D91C4|nr:hypothetical protein [Microvirga calopogonii]